MSSEHTADWRPEDDAARERVRRSFWDKLRRVAARIPFTEDLLAAHYCAFDRNTPRHVQASLIGALAYFISPLDVLPDLLPIVGLTDDAAVLAGVVRLVWGNIRPEHRDAARQMLDQLKAAPKP